MTTILFALLAAAASEEVSTTVAPESSAISYAHGSKTLLGSASLAVGLFGSSQAGTGFQAIGLTGGLAMRFVTRPGFTLEPRLGVDGLVATAPAGLYAVFVARAGLGIGWAFAITDRVALTPMLAGEVQYLGGGVMAGLSGAGVSGALELPLTVFFGKSAFVEVFVRGGAMTMLGEVAPTFAAGYRFGLVL